MTKFVELNLSDQILQAINDLKFDTATEIQAKTIPILLSGEDVIGQAGTGTGKTAAFAIPTIENIDYDSDKLQVLVLCPTRELVVQVAEQYKLLSKYQKRISIVPVYGGQSIEIQLKAIKKSAQVVIGTPGRLMDHMRRGSLDLSELSYVVLDEADQMLNMGFRDDIEIILSETPKSRQTIMFSATMSDDIFRLMKKYQKDPIHINVSANKQQSTQIDQLYYEINPKSKIEALKRLVSFYQIKSALIFCNMKSKVDELVANLNEQGFRAAGLHGDMEQRKRDAVMQGFRKETIRFLVATDIAARGIDVNDIDAVFNFDLPRYHEDYVHRIGRTGRAGKTGKAFSFVIGKEIENLKKIARMNKLTIEVGTIPQAADMEVSVLDSIKKQIEKDLEQTASYKRYSLLLDKLEIENCPKTQIAAVLLKLLMDKDSQALDSEVDFSPERFRSTKSRGDFSSRSRSSSRSGSGSRSSFKGGSNHKSDSFKKRPSNKRKPR